MKIKLTFFLFSIFICQLSFASSVPKLLQDSITDPVELSCVDEHSNIGEFIIKAELSNAARLNPNLTYIDVLSNIFMGGFSIKGTYSNNALYAKIDNSEVENGALKVLRFGDFTKTIELSDNPLMINIIFRTHSSTNSAGTKQTISYGNCVVVK